MSEIPSIVLPSCAQAIDSPNLFDESHRPQHFILCSLQVFEYLSTFDLSLHLLHLIARDLRNRYIAIILAYSLLLCLGEEAQLYLF